MDNIGELLFPTANLSVAPSSGPCEKQLTFAASGFVPSESVQIYKSGIGSAVLATATADSSGSFTATADSPQAPFGPRSFLGVGQTSGKIGAASFSVTPRLLLNPSSGPPGTTVTVEGCGFGSSYYTVYMYWDNPRTLLGTTTADFDGTFKGSSAFTFTVPMGGAPGANGVIGNARHQERGYGHFTVQ